MIRAERWCLWVGDPSWLFRVRSGLLDGISISQVSQGPALETAGVDAFATWLSATLSTGSVIDVIHQNHMILVESFPRLTQEDLESAFELRLRRDPLVAPSTLTAHLVAHQRPSGSQAIYAAVTNAHHLEIERPIEAAGCTVGRLGFAGQLAVRAAIEATPAGGWGVVEDLADARSFVIAHTLDGEVYCDAAREESPLPELLRIKLPRLDAQEQPAEVLPPTKVTSTAGDAPPPRIVRLVSIFSKLTDWRHPSRSDIDYPYGLALSTWSVLALVCLLALYTAHLLVGSHRIDASAATLARLNSEAAMLKETEKNLATRRAALDHLESDITIVGAEAFDTGAWLQAISEVRDRATRGLLFESVEVRSNEIHLSGTHSSSQGILALHQELGRWLGSKDVNLSGLQETTGGSESFTIRILRSTARPPDTLPEGSPSDG